MKIGPELPKTVSKTHSGARARPELKNQSKMISPTPKIMPQTPHVGSSLASNLDVFELVVYCYLSLTLDRCSSRARWRVRNLPSYDNKKHEPVEICISCL